MLWREQYERVVLAGIGQSSEPFSAYDAQMAVFDQQLEAEPQESAEAEMARRDAELMEMEVA